MKKITILCFILLLVFLSCTEANISKLDLVTAIMKKGQYLIINKNGIISRILAVQFEDPSLDLTKIDFITHSKKDGFKIKHSFQLEREDLIVIGKTNAFDKEIEQIKRDYSPLLFFNSFEEISGKKAFLEFNHTNENASRNLTNGFSLKVRRVDKYGVVKKRGTYGEIIISNGKKELKTKPTDVRLGDYNNFSFFMFDMYNDNIPDIFILVHYTGIDFDRPSRTFYIIALH